MNARARLADVAVGSFADTPSPVFAVRSSSGGLNRLTQHFILEGKDGV